MNLSRIEGRFQASPDGKCAAAEGGMVATAFPHASRAGVEMLERGGNAIDAACAAALALGVCEPQASGLGGQSLAIVHFQGNTIGIDGSSRVPSLAHISKFIKGERTTGYRATTVPSTVAVMGHLNNRYGRLEWSTIFEPAIRIAKEGYPVTRLQRDLQIRELTSFDKVPSRSGARYFLKEGAQAYEEGELFKQPDLARLLEHIAEHGPRSFYQGEVARQIDEDMKANGGFLRADDLALIPWPIERAPLKRRYRDVSVTTMPPPAAGRTLLLVLMMLNNLPRRFLKQGSSESYHFLAETFRKAFLQRVERPFDPNTYPQRREQKMMNRDFARSLAESIRDTIDPGLPLEEPPLDEADTTHLSVMDAEGNAVGITQSIERVYGSKAAAEGLGFLYNNYMLALETKEASHPHYLRPGASPWTTVAPAILFHKKQPWMVVGSPGSERIFSTVSQFIAHVVDGGSPICEAMRKPRLHCSMGGKISLEAERFDSKIIDYLERLNYKMDLRDPYSFYLGAVHAVMKCQKGKGFQGVAEVRRDGAAEGLR